MVLIVFCHEDNSSHLKKSQKHKTIPNSTAKMPPSTILTKIGGSLAFSRVHQPWRSKEGEFFCHHQKFMFIALILWVFPALFLCEKSCSTGSSPAKTTYYLATLHRVWENPIWEPSPKWMSFSENSIAFIIIQRFFVYGNCFLKSLPVLWEWHISRQTFFFLLCT